MRKSLLFKITGQLICLAANFLTSIAVVFGTLVVVSAVAAMAAFIYSKLDFSFKKAIYYMLLTEMMIPASALIFPLFQIVKGLKINNTPFSLIFKCARIPMRPPNISEII